MKKTLKLLVSIIMVFSLGLQCCIVGVMADNDGTWLFDIIYAGGKYVAVGCPSLVKVSNDAIDWTYGTVEGDAHFFGAAYGAGRYAAVGCNDSGEGVIQTSTDGLTWKSAVGIKCQMLNDVVWNGKIFAAVGYQGTIYTSPDGISWTARTSGITDSIESIIWDGSSFIAGISGYSGSNSLGYLLTSKDGTSWTAQKSDGLPGLCGIASNNTVTVGICGDNKIYYSYNKVDWKKSDSDIKQYLKEIIWNGSSFMVVGANGYIATSKDGVTWTDENLKVKDNLNGVAWDGKQFVIVGDNEIVITFGNGSSVVTGGYKDSEANDSEASSKSTVIFNSTQLYKKILEVKSVCDNYYDMKQMGVRPTKQSDSSGSVVASYIYSGGRMDCFMNKGADGNWMTTAYNKYDFPMISGHGKLDGDSLREAYEQITDGTYDFDKNNADVACIYFYVHEIKRMDTAMLRTIINNPEITDDQINELKGKAEKLYDAMIGMTVGYTTIATEAESFKTYGTVIVVNNSAYYHDIKADASQNTKSKTEGASSWAAAEIEKAIGYGLSTDRILSSYQNNITREEFCEIAVKLYEQLSGKKAVAVSPNPFTDTTNSEILKAYNLKISNGKTATEFKPNDPITRQELAVMIRRALQAAIADLNTSIDGASSFSDDKDIASWAVNDVKFCNKNGIMNGVGENKINPAGYTTREQAVLMLVRAYEKFVK